MKALVLSAGYGERLRPLTKTIPKPLLEIGGRPLIHYPLLMIKAAGVTEVAINLHHLADQIEQRLGTGESLDLAITYSREAVLMGTGGPLLMLRDYFRDEPFLILNCDTIIDLDLRELISFHTKCGGIATLTLHAPDSDRYSHIEIDDDAQIRRMKLLKGRIPGEFQDYVFPSGDKASSNNPLMYCGVMVCEPAVLDWLPKTAPFGLIADLLAPLLSQGQPQFGFLNAGYFRTVDDLRSYQDLRVEFDNRTPPLSFLKFG
jgi:mannose-1-phosphate guanylyltransferase